MLNKILFISLLIWVSYRIGQITEARKYFAASSKCVSYASHNNSSLDYFAQCMTIEIGYF